MLPKLHLALTYTVNKYKELYCYGQTVNPMSLRRHETFSRCYEFAGMFRKGISSINHGRFEVSYTWLIVLHLHYKALDSYSFYNFESLNLTQEVSRACYSSYICLLFLRVNGRLFSVIILDFCQYCQHFKTGFL